MCVTPEPYISLAMGCSYGIPHLTLHHQTKCPVKPEMARQLLCLVGKRLMSGRYFAHWATCLDELNIPHQVYRYVNSLNRPDIATCDPTEYSTTDLDIVMAHPHFATPYSQLPKDQATWQRCENNERWQNMVNNNPCQSPPRHVSHWFSSTLAIGALWLKNI